MFLFAAGRRLNFFVSLSDWLVSASLDSRLFADKAFANYDRLDARVLFVVVVLGW